MITGTISINGFFYTAILFWGIKMAFTTYTMREVFWIAVMMGIGVMLSVITRQNMWLLSIMTVVAMKNCRFSVIAQIAVWIRCVAAVILSGGSLIGIFDIGEKDKTRFRLCGTACIWVCHGRA